MTSRTLTAELTWTSTAPTTARHLLAAWLAECEDELRADVELVASELMTRAIDDYAGDPRLLVVLTPDDVHIAVDSPTTFVDTGTRPPILADAVIDRVCRCWGVHQRRTGIRQWGVVTRHRPGG